MVWIWVGVGLYLSVPAVAAALLAGLYAHLHRHYLPLMARIYQEPPLFVIPRGQPRADAEDVRFTTADGLELRGCYFKAAGGRRGVILFAPEFGASRWACASYCDHLVAAGYDVFAYEPRNQGESGREPLLDEPDRRPLHWVSDRDVTDARAAITYLKKRPDADPRGVGLFGISKGAGAGLVAAEGDPAVRCAVTDGMFGGYTVVVPYMRRFILIYNASYFIQGLLPAWYYAILARAGMRQVGAARGVRFVHVESAVRRFRRPLLMMHGARDGYIFPDMARTLYRRARGLAEFWLIPGASHNQGLHVAPDEYRRRVREFFDAHLAG